jgi:hypothetical protein
MTFIDMPVYCCDMKPKMIEFEDLERKVSASGKSFKDILVTELAKRMSSPLHGTAAPHVRDRSPNLISLLKTFHRKRMIRLFSLGYM